MSEGLVLPQPGARRSTGLAALVLVAVTAVWGSTFVLIKDVVATIPVPDFLALRFLIAAAVMVPVFWRPLRRLSRDLVLRGLALGAVYGVAQVFQTFGLAHTSAAVSGFVTGMYVVLTPVIGVVLLRPARPGQHLVRGGAVHRRARRCWRCNGFAVGTGELLVLVSAFLYALHIVALGRGPGRRTRWAGDDPDGRDRRAVHRGRAAARHHPAVHRRGHGPPCSTPRWWPGR